MSEKPLLVYLDTSDFSNMSDPRLGDEWKAERDALTLYVERGAIRCVFSQAHLVEIAPLERSLTELSVQKVDLLVALCSAFALPSLDRLLAGELTALREARPREIDVISPDGGWFPSLDGLIEVPTTSHFSGDDITQAIAEYGGTRAQRREAKRRLLKNGQPSPKFAQLLKTDRPVMGIQDVQRTYPMRDEDAQTFVEFIRGHASVSDAQRALEASLRDPRFMMRWFASKDVDVTKFTSWLRDSSRQTKAAVERLAAAAIRVREVAMSQQSDLIQILSKAEWDRRADSMVASIAQRLADEFLPASPMPLPTECLTETCAGLNAMLRTFMDAAWTATAEKTPRTPSSSDLGDSFHAMYAPYVDLFRPDRNMAPHVARHVEQYGTQVVPRLKQLIPAIDARLSRKTCSA